MKYRRPKSGFTLIEMIVSLAVFSVVVTISVGALLILIASNRQLQEEQSVLSNLAFALDSMTREIRTGSQYYCFDANNDTGNPGHYFATQNLDNLGLDDVLDCPTGRQPASHNYQGVAFYEGGDSITGAANNRILYFFDDTTHKIYRRTGTAAAQSIVSDGIHVVDAEFFVTGSEPLLGSGSTDQHQSSVTIRIEAAADDPSTVVDTKIYTIQTTVVQRTLDI